MRSRPAASAISFWTSLCTALVTMWSSCGHVWDCVGESSAATVRKASTRAPALLLRFAIAIVGVAKLVGFSRQEIAVICRRETQE